MKGNNNNNNKLNEYCTNYQSRERKYNYRKSIINRILTLTALQGFFKDSLLMANWTNWVVVFYRIGFATLFSKAFERFL